MSFSFASLLPRQPSRHSGTTAITRLAACIGAATGDSVQRVQHSPTNEGHQGDQHPDGAQDARQRATPEHAVRGRHDAGQHEEREQKKSHSSLPAHDDGLNASTPITGTLAEVDCAAISAWADIDTDLGHLATECYCGCEATLLPGGVAAEACTAYGSGTAPRRPGLLRRMRIALVARKLDIVRNERDRYARIGMIGPIYHRNSLVLQIALLARIRELQEAA